ncbi:hypothetical protein IW152_002605 [Coemansia sp. BCRC 34962]|nr:hypothetical protein IW152_002605 [Coemansia sp. BCRC 34962]
MCDPTDLPSTPVPILSVGVQSRGGKRQEMEIPQGLRHSSCNIPHNEENLYIEELMHIIPAQLLTPPPSPTNSVPKEMEVLLPRTQPAAEPAAEPAPNERPLLSRFLDLPPHILLSIVSHIPASDLLHLSQTCTWMRNYLSKNSAIWAQLCRKYLTYTPKHLFNQQAAEYYLGIRGNLRLESLVLQQRERVEFAIDCILQTK